VDGLEVVESRDGYFVAMKANLLGMRSELPEGTPNTFITRV
jgi:hypothetical protein